MAQLSLSDVVSNPEWLPHTYDVDGATLTFVHVPRAARSQLMFLSDEHFAGDFAKAAFQAAAVAAELPSSGTAPLHFVFHTSFCCSTLLAKALDIPGTTSLLKEPDVFINLGNRLIRSDDSANRKRLEIVLRLLERPFEPGEMVIAKPSNFGNRLVDIILSSRPETRAVLLYSDVEPFLLSLLKRGMFGRIFGRKLFNQMKDWSQIAFGFSQSDLFEQTDMQIAGLAWLMQMQHFDAIARAFGPERVMLLNSAELVADPAATIGKAQALLGLGLDSSQVEAIATGPVFAKHAKFADQDFSAEERDAEHRAAIATHGEEVRMVSEWIKAVAAKVGAPLRPGL